MTLRIAQPCQAARLGVFILLRFLLRGVLRPDGQAPRTRLGVCLDSSSSLSTLSMYHLLRTSVRLRLCTTFCMLCVCASSKDLLHFVGLVLRSRPESDAVFGHNVQAPLTGKLLISGGLESTQRGEFRLTSRRCGLSAPILPVPSSRGSGKAPGRRGTCCSHRTTSVP